MTINDHFISNTSSFCQKENPKAQGDNYNLHVFSKKQSRTQKYSTDTHEQKKSRKSTQGWTTNPLAYCLKKSQIWKKVVDNFLSGNLLVDIITQNQFWSLKNGNNNNNHHLTPLWAFVSQTVALHWKQKNFTSPSSCPTFAFIHHYNSFSSCGSGLRSSATH